MPKFRIIYPDGDYNMLTVRKFEPREEQFVDFFALASREVFTKYEDAWTYGKTLAREHCKIWVDDQNRGYLD